MPPIAAIIILYGLGLTASMQVGLIGPIAPDLRAGFGLSQAELASSHRLLQQPAH